MPQPPPAPPANPYAPKVRPGEHVSEAAEVVRQRYEGRALETVEVDGFFGIGDKPIPAIVVRVPTKWEQDNAISLARAYVKANVDDEDARKDPKVLQDAEHACVAWWACRDAKDPTYPAFPSPEWMAKTMSAEQIGTLVRAVNAVRAKRGPMSMLLTPETLDAWIDGCAKLADTDAPAVMLASVSHAILAQAFVMASLRVVELTSRIDDLARASAERHAADIAAEAEPAADEPEPTT